MPKESTLKKNCVALIRQHGGFARSIPGGPLGAGLPDILAVYRGVPLMLEAKLPGKERNVTALQANTLREAKEAGAVSRVITSKQQVQKILARIDYLKDRKK